MGCCRGVPPTLLQTQYVARPPERSKTPPVVKEHSAVHNQATIAAISSVRPKRPMGIFESMKSICACVICANMPVFTAAGVTQFTRTPLFASSLPSDLVSEITPALEALYAEAL